MRILALVFLALIAALQYPMWLGKGGWLQVREFDRQVVAQRAVNAGLKLRNDALDAEVRDLKTGYEAIEERARSELGMIRQDEVFFQLQDEAAPAAPPAASPGRPRTAIRACARWRGCSRRRATGARPASASSRAST
ncbi:MAG: cell division protein FtsB [Betaproteobacteria bacterium]|nr:cell division protein FtsB [Betaproteobacteria bacterium]